MSQSYRSSTLALTLRGEDVLATEEPAHSRTSTGQLRRTCRTRARRWLEVTIDSSVCTPSCRFANSMVSNSEFTVIGIQQHCNVLACSERSGAVAPSVSLRALIIDESRGPVMLHRLGGFRLATRPSLTGSLPSAKTTGVDVVTLYTRIASSRVRCWTPSPRRESPRVRARHADHLRPIHDANRPARALVSLRLAPETARRRSSSCSTSVQRSCRDRSVSRVHRHGARDLRR